MCIFLTKERCGIYVDFYYVINFVFFLLATSSKLIIRTIIVMYLYKKVTVLLLRNKPFLN